MSIKAGIPYGGFQSINFDKHLKCTIRQTYTQNTPNSLRDVLIAWASLSRCPVLPLSATLSDPARSTKFRYPILDSPR